MKHIAVTGHMGSGKSFICTIFHEEFGIPVFDSDSDAKSCYGNDTVIRTVRLLCGASAITSDGGVDMNVLSREAFSHPNVLEQLSSIIHPMVMGHYREWHKKQAGKPYSIFESAILYECGLDKLFDAVIRVTCPDEVAVARVKERNGWSDEQIMQRLHRQREPAVTHPKEFLLRHDSTLPPDESRNLLLPQLETIHKQIISM